MGADLRIIFMIITTTTTTTTTTTSISLGIIIIITITITIIIAYSRLVLMAEQLLVGADLRMVVPSVSGMKQNERNAKTAKR